MADSIVGNPKTTEGQIDVHLDAKNGAQAMPSQNIQNKGALMGNMFPYQDTAFDSGPVMDGMMNEAAQRPSVPSPDLKGGLDAKGCADDMDFNSVAPYSDPEYPGAASVPKTRYATSVPD